jgi:hypothetical protein
MTEHEHDVDDFVPPGHGENDDTDDSLARCGHNAAREVTPDGWVRCKRCGTTLSRVVVEEEQ